MQCTGIVKKESRQCKNKALPGNDRCRSHRQCVAFTKKSNGACRCRHKEGLNSEFRCKYHVRAERCPTSPSLFRNNVLRSSNCAVVREFRAGKDAYRNTKLPTNLKEYELDHVLELQVVRDCYDRCIGYPVGMGFQQKKERLLFDLKAAANDTTNLNFTLRELNERKEMAVMMFQNHYVMGVNDDQGLFGCLVDTAGSKVSRTISRRIQDETYRSGYAIIDALQTEDCVVRTDMVDTLQRNLAAMKLK